MRLRLLAKVRFQLVCAIAIGLLGAGFAVLTRTADGLTIPEAIDLGDVWETQGHATDLAVLNRSKRTTRLISFQPDCSCTLVGKRTCTLAPGESETIPLILDLREKSGTSSPQRWRFSSSIAVSESDPQTTNRIRIVGFVKRHPILKVLPPFDLPSPVLTSDCGIKYFGKVYTDGSIESLVATIQPEGYFRSTVHKLSETVGTTDMMWQIEVTSVRPLPAGVNRVDLTLFPTLRPSAIEGNTPQGPVPPVSHSCVISVHHHVALSPQKVTLGSIPIGKPHAFSIETVKCDCKNFSLRSTSSSDRRLSVSASLAKSLIRVRVTPTSTAHGESPLAFQFDCDGIAVHATVGVVLRTLPPNPSIVH